MVCAKKTVLDVLKPHLPNVLEFSRTVAGLGTDYRVHLTVIDVDERTETLRVLVEGGAVDIDAIQPSIKARILNNHTSPCCRKKFDTAFHVFDTERWCSPRRRSG